MLQTLTYKVNVAPDGVPPMVRLSQNENGRILQFELCGKGEVTIPSGSQVTISGTKPDGVVYSATGSLSGVIATFAEDVQMTAVTGEWDAKLRVIYNGETIATIKIWFYIDSDSVEPGAVPSESELNGLVAEAQQYAETARSEAYGSPLTASTAAAMTNTDKVYVYTGSESGYLYGHWYYYNGTTWADGGVYQSQGVQTDPTLTQEGVPADAKATGDRIGAAEEDVADLKDAIDNKVDLTGENQVTPQNIEGMRFTKTAQEVAGENIFSESYLGENGYYASVNSAVTPPIIAHGSASTYRWYAIPVDGVSKYTFTEARFACLAKGNTIGSEAIGTTLSYTSEVTTTGASYLILSYLTSVTNIEVRKIDVEYVYSDFIPPDWMTYRDTKPKYVSTTGNLSDGTFLALMGYKQNLRKGERYVFRGNIGTISTLTLGFIFANAFSASTTIYNAFIIDNTNITYKTISTNETYTYQYAHGLTLTNNLQFTFEYLPEGNVKITLISNGMLFTQTLPFVKWKISQVVVLSTGSTLSDCKLTWAPIDIDKNIWMFGDSYFAYNAARWTYYLQQYGYAENALIDGWPGEGSVNARNSLMTLIQFGTPKYIVWCMGMNDGSDTDASTPNSDWAIRRDEMLAICNNNGITPIFATIPNVPSILHTGKNAWIKASGYRYIDFAAAVGAEAAGSTWFSGMLSSDNVHPSESGAKALFAQALVDFPEIMLNN